MTTQDDLLCMFTTTVSEDEDSYTIEVPASEVELGAVDPETPVRVGVYAQDRSEAERDGRRGSESSSKGTHARSPPVDEGEQRTVTIEHLGEKGDGIAKVESGFVLIVPDADVGEELDVEIKRVNENFAIAEPLEGENTEAEPTT